MRLSIALEDNYRMLRLITALLALLMFALPIMAQEESEDAPITLPLDFDRLVEETITDRAFYDWWTIDLLENDEIHIEMTGYDGLVPLLGILDPDRNLVARSDTDVQPEPNGIATLDFTAEYEGRYTIVATREGNEQGISTGDYTLLVGLIARVPSRENDRIPVEFRCHDAIATTALFFQALDEFGRLQVPLEGDAEARMRITVIGEGDFEPLILLQVSDRSDQSCIDVPPIVAEGFSYQAPGMQPTGEITSPRIVQSTLSLQELDWADYSLDVLVGSRDGQPGKFVVFVEGLEISSRGDIDIIPVRRGPMARNTPLSAYMLAVSMRFDPFVTLSNADETLSVECDDAGMGNCENMPSAEDISFVMTYPDDVTVTFAGHRFDAGVQLFPDYLDTQDLILQSRNGSTHGTYALMFIGELPAP